MYGIVFSSLLISSSVKTCTLMFGIPLQMKAELQSTSESVRQGWKVRLIRYFFFRPATTANKSATLDNG